MTARAAGLVPFVLASVTPANAAATPPPVRLSWNRGADAATCLDERELAERVRARLGRDPFSDAAEFLISGTVTRNGDRFRADLDVRDRSGRALGHRELDSPSDDCAPLGDAVVLAVALTIDPEKTVGSAAAFSTPSDSEFGEPEAPAAPCPLPSPAPEIPPPPPCPAPVVAPSKHGVDVAVLGSAVIAFGALPGASAGAAVEGRAERGAFSGFLGVAYFPEKSSSDPRVDLGLTFATVGGCYDAPLPHSNLLFCAGLEVGAIHSVVKQIAPVRPGDEPWVSVELGPRFVWKGLSPLLLEARISGVVPLDHKDFGIVDEAPFFREAPFGALGSVGVGIGSF